MHRIILNSSGSEEEWSPPEGGATTQIYQAAPSVPYNTPVDENVALSLDPNVPSAEELQAALMRHTRRDPLEPIDINAGREQHNAKERARRLVHAGQGMLFQGRHMYCCRWHAVCQGTLFQGKHRSEKGS